MEHEALLRTVELSDRKAFIKWFEETQLENISGVKEAVDCLSKKELSGIWTVFFKWVTESISAFMNSEKADREFMYSTFSSVSSMAIYSIEHISSSEPQTLGPAIKALNNVLKSVSCKKTGILMCRMCEKYWKTHPELELSLTVNVIYWYLNQALLPKAPASSIKSVGIVKDLLLKLNVDVLESSGILNLLLSGISNSKFLASPEGKKCISCLFNFGANITQMLQAAVKKIIPVANVSDCEALGEIYFRGWRTITSEQFRADVEFSIQDIMYSAVLAHRKPIGAVEGGVNTVPMNKLLFHMLHAIHRQKKQRTIAILIYTLYKPILWRYLEASNGMVRANALCLFFDAFPFESGECIEEDEVVRNKQWSVMLAALMDPLPLVRSIAIQGTSRVLAEYWELIPVDIIQKIITCMLRKLLFDSSSTEVRAQVVKGLAIMLESSQTHLLLEKMIPLTNKVLHDPQEKVRAEYAALLTHIQKLNVSKLWDVIDVNELVIRLAVDTSKTVCRRLVILLAPFFHPKSQPEVVFQRCLRLVIDNRAASRKFYLHINQCVEIQQMTQLILIIWKFLRNHIHKQLEQMRLNVEKEETEVTAYQLCQQKRRTRAKRSRRNEPTQETPGSSSSGDENKGSHASSINDADNKNEDQFELSEANILGLFDVVCILLNTNKPKFKTPPYVKFWDNIKSRFNKTCSMFFRYFRNSEGLRTLIYLYGQLSSSSSPMMLSFVKSQLKSLKDEASVKEFSHLVDVLCNWNRGEDLLEFVSDNVLGHLTTQQELAETSRHSTRASKKKRVSFQRTTADEKPLLGVRCMAYILQSPQNKKIVFRLNLTQVEQFCSNLKQIMELVDRDREKLTSTESFIVFASKLYVRIVLVLTSAYKRDKETQSKYLKMQDDILEILNWVKRLISIENLNSVLENIVFDVLSSINNLIMIHSIEWNVCLHFLSVFQDFLEQIPRSDNIIMSLNSAHYVLELVWTRRTIEEEHDTRCDDQITALIKKALDCCVAGPGEGKALTEAEASKAKDSLRNILEVCHHYGLAEHKSLRDILLVLISTMKEEMIQFLQDPANAIKCTKDLPQVSDVIVGVLRTQNAFAEMIFSEIFQNFKENANDVDLLSLSAVATLIGIISRDQGKISTKSLIQAVGFVDHMWSTINNLEKEKNKVLACSIGDVIKELKVTFN